jgi:hypothetical protein
MVIGLALMLNGCADEGVRPSAGYVPDEATAVRIAKAVWTPIYGEKQLRSEPPFHAELKGNVWHVYNVSNPPMPGGGPEAEIDRRTGKVLREWHGQ